MAPKRSKKKILLRLLLALILGLVVLLVACPVWLPWLLKPILNHYNVGFDSYDRQGYSRLAFRNVLFQQDGTRVTAEEVTLLQPTTWLWKHYFPGPPTDHLSVTDWTLHIAPSKQPAQPSTEPAPTTTAILDIVDQLLPTIRQWVPAASLSRGTVTFANESLSLESVTWRDGQLDARVARQDQTLNLDAHLGDVYQIDTRVQPFDLTLSTKLKKAGSNWMTHTEILWHTNRAELSSRFVPEDSIPDSASLTAPPWSIPAELLGLTGYADPSSSVSAIWTNNQLEVTFAASAEPAGTNQLPPIRLSATAAANPDTVRIPVLQISSPGINAQLNAPVVLSTAGQLQSGKASLQLAFDLDKLPFPDLHGSITGELTILPATNSPVPRATLRLEGNGLAFGEHKVTHLLLQTGLAWPTLSVSQLDLTLPDNTLAQVTAELDLVAQQINTASWTVDGSIPALPDGYEGRGFKTTGTASGPWTNLTHAGSAQLRELIIPGLHPLQTTLDWTGQSLTLSNAALTARAGQSQWSINASSELTLQPQLNLAVSLDRIELERTNTPIYRLENKTTISLQLPGPNAPPGFDLTLAPLHLRGPGRSIDIQADLSWPGAGSVDLEITGLDPTTFREFVSIPDAGVLIDNLNLAGNWTNGPLQARLDLAGRMAGIDGQTFSARTRIVARPDGLLIEPSTLSAPSGPVVSFEGDIPLQIHPGNLTNLYTLSSRAPLRLSAATQTNAAFWAQLAELTGAQLAAPSIRVNLQGTAAALEGTIQAQADLIKIEGMTNLMARLPKMDDLRINAVLSKEKVVLEQLSLNVEGQAVRLDAQLPLADDFWPQLFEKPRLPDWEQGSARLQIINAAVAPFSSYLPTLLTPNGQLSLDLTVLPGRQLKGTLDLTNAATRALPPLGPIRDITAHIGFQERSATIKGFTGYLGGQPVTLSGTVDSPGLGLPEFNLRLKGERIPFIRKAGLLLRSDIDLRAKTRSKDATNTGPAVVISGDLIPRDSLFLQDLKSLIPGGLAQAERRPPYFRITEQPFADWALNIRIKGDRFLRVRTPLFRGELSLDMLLQGPLREPVSLGEIRIDDGSILFPFADLNVDQGSIRLTRENPYDPELLISSSARAFGYSLRLEATGRAGDPSLTFNSTPPLTSEEILLMLTAGELPKREVVFTSKQKAGRLATLLGKDLLARISGREDKAERLIIRSGENVSESGSLTYYIEYKLTDTWSVVGESDRFNALNAGAKWKIYSR